MSRSAGWEERKKKDEPRSLTGLKVSKADSRGPLKYPRTKTMGFRVTCGRRKSALVRNEWGRERVELAAF